MNKRFDHLLSVLRNSREYNYADVRLAADIIEEQRTVIDRAQWGFLNRLDRELDDVLSEFITRETGYDIKWTRTVQNDDPLYESILVESPLVRLSLAIKIERNDLLKLG